MLSKHNNVPIGTVAQDPLDQSTCIGYVGFVLQTPPMRTVSVHPEKSIRFTKHAKTWCIILNNYKRMYPQRSFAQAAQELNISETSARRYYYGMHQFDAGFRGISYNQVRRGACCPI